MSTGASSGGRDAEDLDKLIEIKPYLDAGFTHLLFHGPGHDQHRFLTTFSEQVLPKSQALQ